MQSAPFSKGEYYAVVLVFKALGVIDDDLFLEYPDVQLLAGNSPKNFIHDAKDDGFDSSDIEVKTEWYNETNSKVMTTFDKSEVGKEYSVTVDGITYKVESIANNAFKGNKKITSVTIGKNVKTIGKNAFANCSMLKTVNCKSTVLSKIGATAFYGDKKLTNMTLKSTRLSKKNIGKNAIKGTSSKLVIKAPKKSVKNYRKYFKAKGNKKVKVKES